MKKVILLSFLLVSLIPSHMHSLGLVLGVKGGAGLCSYSGWDYRYDLENSNLANTLKLGFAAGVFCTLDIFPVLSFQPELLLVRSGNGATEEAFFWGPYDGKVRHIDVLTYLSIPVLMKIRLAKTIIFAGPDVRIRMGNGSARLKADDETLQEMFESMGLDSMEYADDVFSSVVYAVVFGVEFGLPVKFLSGEWSLETRVQYAFTNLYSESQGSHYNALEIVLMVSYGLRVLGSKPDRSRLR